MDSLSWKYISTINELEHITESLNRADVIAVDTETTGLDPHTAGLRLIQFAVTDEPVYVVDCFALMSQRDDRVLTLLRSILGSDAVKVFQNAKFDIQFLRGAGIDVKGRLFDTLLAGQLLRSSGGPNRSGLAQLAEHYLGETVSKEEQTSDFSGELTESQLIYAAKDAEVLLRLRAAMIPELKKNRLVEVARLEFACVYGVASMEYDGIHLNMDKWQILTGVIEAEQKRALEGLYPYIGYPTVQLGFFESSSSNEVNLNSNQQVLKLLKKHGLELENTSRHTLTRHLDNPIVKLLLDYRHAAKALSTFLYGMSSMLNRKTGRLHPYYSQNGAYSGRMSCGNPNIQQIPRENRFRECFTAPAGRKLVIADYSQIELRVIAQYSQDQRMLQAYRNGEDLHKLTASLMMQKSLEDVTKEERQAAKAVNFGLVFGMGAAGLKAYAADTYGSAMTLEEAELFKKRFFEGYRGVDRWQRQIRRHLPEEERTLAGRKFRFRKEAGLSGRYNTPIQGTAADILKNALGMLPELLRDKDTYIAAVVHDEIVLECPKELADQIAELLTETMEQAGAKYLRDVPVVAEASVADSWAGK